MNPPHPPKRRRLRAPIEPDIADAVDDDPRSALYKSRRRDSDQRAGAQLDARRASASDPPHAGYAELHCLSNFSFQRGASSARELFDRAQRLGYAALAITDECSLSGIVRALEAFDATKVKLIVGTEVRLDDGVKLVLLAANQDGYTDLCRLITTGRRRSVKGEYSLQRSDIEALGDGVLVLWIPAPPTPPEKPDVRKTRAGSKAAAAAAIARSISSSSAAQVRAPLGTGQDRGAADLPITSVREKRVDYGHPPSPGFDADECAGWIARHFGDRAWLAVELHRGPDDAKRLAELRALADRHGLRVVAAGDVHMHLRRRRALQDVMTAIRLRCSVAEAGLALFPNGERHLRRVDQLQALYPPELLAETLRIADRCEFNLRHLKYEYPHELVPDDRGSNEHLRVLTYLGAARRYPQGIPPGVRDQVEKELALIETKKYEHFFLTVADIVDWARAQAPPILCQGRGSSANSAVCYCLWITTVSPDDGNLLFERFLSMERDEPPDIDVDFEHERREEVIQYVFNKYGRGRAALAATVISYRGKSAVRDVGRALGLPEDQLERLTGMFSRVRSDRPLEDWLTERGFDPTSRVLHRLFALASEIHGFPRHLSQHVGGFVISEKPLHYMVPVENASMPERTIIQWDKDDLETMKMLKVDCLALGMLTCLHKCFDLLHEHGLWTRPKREERPSLGDVPMHEYDEGVYDMICRADTVGVFQIESRAQMSMLPRLLPRTFYDLVVEIAIVRPGPIQGQMVHPYLRRRKGHEPVDYPQSRAERESGSGESAIRKVLERTLGVPIFQEQVMKLIQVVAGFSGGQADELRRAMAAWKRRGGLDSFHDRIKAGMQHNGYSDEYFERIFEQIKGFGEYGFPESHSASFAVLAYASSWLKCHHPAAFTCALLNAQPMGFYQPSQLIQDAQKHGVHVTPADVTLSGWDCSLETSTSPPPMPAGVTAPRDALALRLGLRQINGLSRELAERLVDARNDAPFRDVADMTRRARVTASERARLADAGALQTLSGHRYRARWDSAGAELPMPVLENAGIQEKRVGLRRPSLREDVMTDYATQGLSLNGHPLGLIRDQLDRLRIVPASTAAAERRDGRHVRCAGLVTVRQHPGTAKGVTFVTLEDETGFVNVVVWRALAQAQHRVLLEAVVMGVEGVLQVSEGVRHVIAKKLHDYSGLLPEFAFASRDFH